MYSDDLRCTQYLPILPWAREAVRLLDPQTMDATMARQRVNQESLHGVICCRVMNLPNLIARISQDQHGQSPGILGTLESFWRPFGVEVQSDLLTPLCWVAQTKSASYLGPAKPLQLEAVHLAFQAFIEHYSTYNIIVHINTYHWYHVAHHFANLYLLCHTSSLHNAMCAKVQQTARTEQLRQSQGLAALAIHKLHPLLQLTWAWRIVKNREDSWRTVKNREESWRIVKNREESWRIVKNREEPWRIVKNREESWRIVKNREESWRIVKNREESWRIVKNREESWRIVKNREESWRIVKNREESWRIVKNREESWTWTSWNILEDVRTEGRTEGRMSTRSTCPQDPQVHTVNTHDTVCD